MYQVEVTNQRQASGLVFAAAAGLFRGFLFSPRFLSIGRLFFADDGVLGALLTGYPLQIEFLFMYVIKILDA